jgi:cysteine desulfurase / selenocysteine lyase
MDVTQLRREFPALARQTYLNHAGVAPTSTRVARAVAEWIDDLVQYGVKNEHRWEERANEVRALCARLVGAGADEIAFVRNTSHGLGLIAEGLPWATGDEVAVCTELEYPSNVYPWLHLADRGVVTRAIEPRDGGVTPSAVEAAITARTKLVAVSSVQYATGHRTDLDAIGAICAARNVLFCVDGIQSVGAAEIDVKRSKIHFLSADSHKWMLGMPGIGFLYVDRAVIDRIRPVLVGWHSTTDAWNFDRAHFELRRDVVKLEEGSPAYTGIWGLGATVELLLEVGIKQIATRISELVALADRRLRDVGCETWPRAEDRAGIVTCVPRGDVRAVHERLCASDVSVSLRRGRIRVSPHVYTLDDEIEKLVDVISSC